VISYTGIANLFQATVFLFGDGVTTAITIDISQSPFGVKFINVPTRVIAFNYAADQPKLRSIDIVAPKSLVIVFEDPLPLTPFTASSPGNVIKTRLDLYFIYETQPITTL
jgi:hypothetical protein